jgi:Mg2+-importing ATPase
MNKALTQGFSTFLRRRRAKAHFERRPVLETFTASPSTDLPQGVAARGEVRTGRGAWR